jgi:hypothetical protein
MQRRARRKTLWSLYYVLRQKAPQTRGAVSADSEKSPTQSVLINVSSTHSALVFPLPYSAIPVRVGPLGLRKQIRFVDASCAFPLASGERASKQSFRAASRRGCLFFTRAKKSHQKKARQSEHPQEELHEDSANGLRFHSQRSIQYCERTHASPAVHSVI